MMTLEEQLRDTMREASDHLELPDGAAHDAWIVGRRQGRGRAPRWVGQSRLRLALAGGLAVVVAVIATAFALGGGNPQVHPSALEVRSPSGQPPHQLSGRTVPRPAHVPLHARAIPREAVKGVRGAAGTAEATPLSASTNSAPQVGAVTSGTTGQVATASSGSGVTATRVVKTGSLALTVKKGQVQATMAKLVALTTRLGGYVSASHTDNVAGSPSGELTLRMPVGQFDAAVSGAQTFGHETSLTTNAHDVTGKFVDLNTRLSALRRTRQTYLTILGRATTIGQTLEVQQRVEDVQQQIEQLQGELKVLRNQSADGTLTVDVAQAGAVNATVHHHHRRHGISKAWHTSISRFARGIDAIVGALGPLLLGVLILGVLALVGRLGYRVVRR